MARLALPSLVLACCATAAASQVQNIGDVTFPVPPGWRFEQPSGDQFVSMVRGSGDTTSVIAVFKPLRAGGNTDADFRAAWAEVVRSMPAPEPIYSHTSSVGYAGAYGATTTDDGSHYVHLYVLEAGASAIPVLVVTVNRRTFDEQLPGVSLCVEGVRLAPLRAEPVKTGVALADLAGAWGSGGESSVSYVTPSGAYAGSSTVAHGQTYVIAPDGGFTYSFAGVANRQTVRGHGDGRVEVADSFLTFREPSQHRVTRYHIIAYQTALNGATVLTLLSDAYEPTGVNVAFYGEKWIRAGK